jgi:hypothetical protein
MVKAAAVAVGSAGVQCLSTSKPNCTAAEMQRLRPWLYARDPSEESWRKVEQIPG